MTSFRDLVAAPHLSIVSRDHDREMEQVAAILDHKALVGGRYELERLLCDLLAVGAPPTPKTLDLIGHSAPETSLLVLGNWVIDATSPVVNAFARELADLQVLQRLGVESVRLLGCATAQSGLARWTMHRLAEVLGVEVYGTTDMIFPSYYDRHGFSHDRRYLLCSASSLLATSSEAEAAIRRPSMRLLDLDSLPATGIAGASRWDVRLASGDDVRPLLGLVQRRHGATMPSLKAEPMFEVAIPSSEPERYYRMEVMLGGEFVRVYPDGIDAPGVLFAVTDPRALKALCQRLSLLVTASPTATNPCAHRKPRS